MFVDRVRVLLLRWAFRLIFGLPRPVKRLLAGPAIRLDGQVLDLDLQLLGRIGHLFASREGGVIDQATIAEQRRQADIAAKITAESVLADEIVTRDLRVAGAEGPLDARLYVPSAAVTPGPVLVYYHGGGFVLGSLESADSLCRLLAAQSGVRVLSVSYRLAPEFPYPAALEDALAAYDWVRDHPEIVDADLVAVGGDSAGANLALVVAHQRVGPRVPAFVLAFYPVTDAERTGGSRELFGSGFGITAADLEALERLYLPDGVPTHDLRGAILRAPDLSGMPPVYLATAGFDPLRDEGEELVERLVKAGVPVVGRRFSGLVHGYANLTAVSQAARDATLDAASALRAGLALAAGPVTGDLTAGAGDRRAASGR